MRELPDIPLKEIKDYAHLIAQGWDTIKETFNVTIPEGLIDELEISKREALEVFEGKEGPSVLFGEEMFKLRPRGMRGVLFVLENDDFQIQIRSPKTDWCVSVEYRSAGLWEYGFEALRDRALSVLLDECRPKCAEHEIKDLVKWQRVSRADFAFDFYSPEFTKDMRTDILDRVVCPAKTKKRIDASIIGSGVRIETITIGKKNNLQLQIYDKGREITDVSGKNWMLKVWEREGYYPPQDKKCQDVWRLEIRMGAEFLKNRGILTVPELYENLAALLTEGLFTRRLTVESVTDKNRWRWALHPLYVAAYKAVGDGVTEMIPLGRQQTESDKARAERLKKNIAGNLRALTFLTIGDMDEADALRLVNESYDLMRTDPDRERKERIVRQRYRYVKEAA